MTDSNQKQDLFPSYICLDATTFGLMHCWGTIKSLRAQSVVEVKAYNLQDMWKWKLARPTTTQKAGYSPGLATPLDPLKKQTGLYPSLLANWWGKGFLFLPFCEWLSLKKVVLSNFWNCFKHLVVVVYFHYRLLLDFRTVFVEIKLPILLYYWITYFFIRGDEKFPFFRPVKAIVRTDAANSMTFLQREFLPSNDT